jgi:hypothetical protein
VVHGNTDGVELLTRALTGWLSDIRLIAVDHSGNAKIPGRNSRNVAATATSGRSAPAPRRAARLRY